MSSVSVAGRVLGGRYKLDRHLADGGMGAIWSAKHLTLGMPVAVKLMSVEGALRFDLRKRFEREAKAVALLRNPHIVQVLDYGTDGDTPFIVMELLDGVDLLGTQRAEASWPLSEVAALVSQVAQGLSVAHRAGLIHRDVKPANIFLARSGKGDEVVAKLIDFGIAKWADNTDVLTGANVILGSPSYMSPEQIRGQQLDGRVDAWALAVVAYALVTGMMPFVGKTGPDIAKQVVMGNRRKIPPHVPNASALEQFFTRALAKDVNARFATVEELAAAFIVVTGAPTPLRTAERAVAEWFRDQADQAETPELEERTGEDSVTNLLIKPVTMHDPSTERPADKAPPGEPLDPSTEMPGNKFPEDVEETVADDPSTFPRTR
jgi:serine/threonine-protein kinase